MSEDFTPSQAEVEHLKQRRAKAKATRENAVDLDDLKPGASPELLDRARTQIIAAMNSNKE